MVICSDAKAVRSAYGASHRPICIFQGQYFRVIYTQRSKHGRWQWPLLGTRASSSGDSAPSGSDADGGLYAGVLVVSSALGISDRALSRGEGAIRPFLASSKISISILKRSPSLTTRARHSQSSCTTPKNVFGEVLAWMAHLWTTVASATVSSNPGLSWGLLQEGTLSSLTMPGRVGWTSSHVSLSVQLACGRPQPVGKPKNNFGIVMMPSIEWSREQNSFHHSGTLSSLSM